MVTISFCFTLSAPRTCKLIQSYKIAMAQSTRSKTSALGNSYLDKDLDKNPSYHDISSRSSCKNYLYISSRPGHWLWVSFLYCESWFRFVVSYPFLYQKSSNFGLSIRCKFSLVENYSKSVWRFNLDRRVLRSRIVNQHEWVFLRSGMFSFTSCLWCYVSPQKVIINFSI